MDPRPLCGVRRRTRAELGKEGVELLSAPAYQRGHFSLGALKELLALRVEAAGFLCRLLAGALEGSAVARECLPLANERSAFRLHRFEHGGEIGIAAGPSGPRLRHDARV